jgi:hypothetical protein
MSLTLYGGLDLLQGFSGEDMFGNNRSINEVKTIEVVRLI